MAPEVKSLAIRLLGGWLLAAGTLNAASLDLDMQKRVRAATFEVVVPKPSEDAVKYERAPPLELLPFSERNDKFWPVGTAFAISTDTFVTAAHVLGNAVGGQGGPPVLRDAQGRTFAIDRVLKYSGHQDFVVFTSAARATASLATATTPQLDEPVFAVGNAMGEGVVIRDGLLTSMTPEDQDGRWKWLRYSAATSPGNSGGPLLNAAGQVVGVVIGKSESENLNYALPIQLVLESDGVAKVQQRYPLRLPVLRDSIIANSEISIPLPLSLGEFVTRLTAAQLDAYRAERSRMLAEKAAEFLPRGKSDVLLGSAEWAVCPRFLMQDKDREWEAGGSATETMALANGGEVCTRTVSRLGLFSVDRGKGVDLSFHADRRRAMDLLLEGLKLPRQFGQELVSLTSLGAPVRDVPHRDAYGRVWRVATFAMPYADIHIVVLMLPTPNGYAGMMTAAPRSFLELTTDELLFASDYFYVSYFGTLPQWQAFLAEPDLPTALAGIKVTRDGQGLHYRSKRIDFDAPPTLLKLDDTCTLQLRMSYAAAGAALVWDVGSIFVSNQQKEERYFSLSRQLKPGAGAGKELTDRWSDMLDSKGDFSPGRGNDADFKKFWRRGVVSAGYKPGLPVDRDAALFYEVISSVDGARMPREVDTMQDLLLENVRVKER